MPDDYLVNHGRQGFYFARYDDSIVLKLAKLIENSKLPVDDRLGLLYETFELAKAGHQKTIVATELLMAFENEDRAPAWIVIVSMISALRRVFDEPDIIQNLRELSAHLLEKQLARVGTSAKASDSHNDKILRPTILSLASFSDNEKVVELAKALFIDIENGLKVDPDLKNFIYSSCARRGNKDLYDSMINLHNSTDSASERNKLAHGITSFKQAELIENTIVYMKSDNVRRQDVFTWIMFLFINPHAKDIAWKWLKEDWPWIVDNFSTDIATFAYIPKFAARAFSNIEYKADFEKFFDTAYSKGINLQIQQGIETIEWQSSWKSRDLEELSNWLVKNLS
jgi:aminopeptidase 2